MITEDYVSFEIAKLLKEKGFNERCYKCYGTAVHHKGVPISFDEEFELKCGGLGDEIEYVEGGCLYDFGCDNKQKETNVWAAPTLQMAIKWLREEHKIFITIGLCTYPILNKCTWIPQVETLNDCYPNVSKEYDTYEEACEAAIMYCLENLI